MGEGSLEARLGYQFQDPSRLSLALTHRSGAAGDNNERLEFLGDAVLGLRVSEALCAAFPSFSEGQLSQQRAWIVSAQNLASIARSLDLGSDLSLSSAEDAIGGRAKPRLLANAVEAVIAAIYLDGGYAAAAAFVDRHILDGHLDESAHHLHEIAYKSALQEWAHAHGAQAPAYTQLSASGPEHNKTFTVEVHLDGHARATATGSTRKAAEQAAAGAALAQLGVLARQPGDPMSASGRPSLPRIHSGAGLPGSEARPPSDQRERPGQKVASHPR